MFFQKLNAFSAFISISISRRAACLFGSCYLTLPFDNAMLIVLKPTHKYSLNTKQFHGLENGKTLNCYVDGEKNCSPHECIGEKSLHTYVCHLSFKTAVLWIKFIHTDTWMKNIYLNFGFIVVHTQTERIGNMPFWRNSKLFYHKTKTSYWWRVCVHMHLMLPNVIKFNGFHIIPLEHIYTAPYVVASAAKMPPKNSVYAKKKSQGSRCVGVK